MSKNAIPPSEGRPSENISHMYISSVALITLKKCSGLKECF